MLSFEDLALPPANAPTLIHVGLHKTASTSLQRTWLKMSNISPMSSGFASSMIKMLHDAVEHGCALDFSPLKNEPMFVNADNNTGRWQVFSSEALSVFRWLETPPDAIAKAYFNLQADLFARLCPNAHVLIVVREPQAWVKSMYLQYLKTGGTLTYRRFLHVHGGDLCAVLAMKFQKAAWVKHYGRDRVHILPFELFRDAPARFFSELHAHTGMPSPPDALQSARMNVSVSAREGEFLRKTNEFIALFMKSETLDQPRRDTLRKIVPMLQSTLRSEIENNKRSLLSRTANKLVSAPDLEGLTADIQTFIRDTFLPMLARETGDLCGYLDSYARKS